MKTSIFKSLLAKSFLVSFSLLALPGGVAFAATPYANATIEGALSPGVYGRIEIGSAPPPPLIYAQPVIIQAQPVLVQQPPLYLHVPPGHAKKWSKHCARYNACGRPVYFVKVRGDEDYERRRHGGRHEERGHGKGHGHGHDRDRHDD